MRHHFPQSLPPVRLPAENRDPLGPHRHAHRDQVHARQHQPHRPVDTLRDRIPEKARIGHQNPVRQALLETTTTREAAIKSLGFDPSKKTILLVGGSLGARTINESVLQHLDIVKNSDVQFIWQTGKYYSEEIAKRLQGEELPNLKVTDFITDMGTAYKAADLVISRAGASSISEFCLIGKPVILVPSPNVAEDHQTKNALALANKDAAIYVKDAEAPATLLELAVKTVNDENKLKSLSENVLKLALPDSAEIIAKEVIKLAK